MLAGRGIGPLARRPLRRIAGAARTASGPAYLDIADQPVPPLALAVGEIMTAHRLGLAREATCQFGSIAAASRGLPFADALDRVALEHLRQDLDAARVGWARTCAASRR